MNLGNDQVLNAKILLDFSKEEVNSAQSPTSVSCPGTGKYSGTMVGRRGMLFLGKGQEVIISLFYYWLKNG